MKDREVMVVYSPCHLTPEERILAKEKYDKAERAEAIPIGNQMLYASYVMSAGKQFSVKNKKTRTICRICYLTPNYRSGA